MEIEDKSNLDIREFAKAILIVQKWNKIDPKLFIELYLQHYDPDDYYSTREYLERGLLLAGLNNSDFMPKKVEKI